MLYVRMLFSMAVSLYTSRVVLNTLGVEDFGIYSVVGGVVSMFALISGSLNSATQRFITFELGKKQEKQLEKVFSLSLTNYLILGLGIVIIAETVGLWFLNNKMNIPPERMNAANWVFHGSLFAFVINLISTPYNATIIAYERMKVFSIISILETFLRLAIVLALVVIPFDKLKTYTILVVVVSLTIRTIYASYCRNHFPETRYQFIWDKEMFNKIFFFAGWNFFGVGSGVLMKEGVSVVINIFFGVTINAARGVARQVETVVSAFVTNFMMALNPQITKSYAAGDGLAVNSFLFRGSKFSFFLIFFLSLPILAETHTILFLWLGQVPDYTVVFLRLSIIYIIINTLSGPLITAMLATGNIKKYQIIVGGLQFLNFPLAYLALRLGFKPQITYVVQIIIALLMLGARLFLLKGMIHFPSGIFVKEVLLKVFLIAICSSVFPFLIIRFMESGVLRFFISSITSVLVTTIFVFFIGLTPNERTFALNKIKNIKFK